MMNSGVFGVCSFGVVYGFVGWFGKAYAVALFFGPLGCRRVREGWRSLP